MLRKTTPASSNAQALETGRSVLSLSQSLQLIGGQRQNTEHQVPHHLGVTLDHDRIAAELILESAIGPLGGGALVMADGFGRRKFDLLAATRVVVDQRNVALTATMVAQLGAAIRGIHQIVEVRDALGADRRQGNRRQAVAHRCRGQHRRDRHAAVSGIEVQLVAVPTDLVALGIALRPPVARRGDVFDHLRQGLLALAKNGRFRGRRTDFTPTRTAPFICRGRLHCGGLALNRAFASFDGGAVAADVADQLVSKIVLDQSFMHAFRQACFGKLIEGARKGGFGGQFPARRETTDAARGAINRQPLDQPPRRAQPQYRLGDKCVRQLCSGCNSGGYAANRDACRPEIGD